MQTPPSGRASLASICLSLCMLMAAALASSWPATYPAAPSLCFEGGFGSEHTALHSNAQQAILHRAMARLAPGPPALQMRAQPSRR